MRNFLLIGILATVTLMSSCSKDLQESIPTDGEYVIESNDGRLFKSSTSYSKDKIIISNGSTDETKKVSIRLCYSCWVYGGMVELGEARAAQDGSLTLTGKCMTPYYCGGEKTWSVSLQKLSEKQVKLAIKVEEDLTQTHGYKQNILDLSGTAALQ